MKTLSQARSGTFQNASISSGWLPSRARLHDNSIADSPDCAICGQREDHLLYISKVGVAQGGELADIGLLLVALLSEKVQTQYSPHCCGTFGNAEVFRRCLSMRCSGQLLQTLIYGVTEVAQWWRQCSTFLYAIFTPILYPNSLNPASYVSMLDTKVTIFFKLIIKF
jgi:hypothetical protein